MNRIAEIEKLLKTKGYTWFQAAEKIGMDYATFHLWMKGEMTQNQAQVIKNALR